DFDAIVRGLVDGHISDVSFVAARKYAPVYSEINVIHKKLDLRVRNEGQYYFSKEIVNEVASRCDARIETLPDKMEIMGSEVVDDVKVRMTNENHRHTCGFREC
ncbi:unnamed protein product, partial [Pylaiella littoralis]